MTGWRSGATASPTSCREPRPGSTTFVPPSTVAGWRALDRKIRRHRPAVVALVGVTLYRAILPLVDGTSGGTLRIRPGLQPLAIHGARVFVLPNPSGRNANFSYAEMLAAFRGLRRHLSRMEGACRS